MLYHRPYAIEFNHCDPAGIVFYPRYFEMTNHICENFFREVVGVPYADMMAQKAGVPTVRIEVDFRKPSRLGDVLDVTLEIQKIGRASMTVQIIGTCNGEHRLTVALTMCWMSDSAAAPWPDAMRLKLHGYMTA